MIKLIISRELNKELNDCIPGLGNFIRVKCRTKFKRMRGDYTEPITGLLDTGAFISLVPYDIWQDMEVDILTTYEMRGVVPKKECKVNVDVGKIKCRIVDEFGNKSGEIETYTYLSRTNRVPLIIGFKGLLERFKIVIDCEKNNAYLD